MQAFDKEEDNQGQVSTLRDLRSQILKIVEEIHQNFGRECLIFEESNPSLEKRLALWSNSDIILCSSLNDGFCLQVLEYVVCRKGQPGIMICSEFAGVHEAISGVLKYNPFGTGFPKILDEALGMTPEEKSERMTQAYSVASRYSFTKWTDDFLKDLRLAYKPNRISFYLGLDFGQGLKQHQIKRLDIE